MKTVCLWSAGKDSCFACYKAQTSGHEIKALLHFTDSNAPVSLGHGLITEAVSMQAASAGIPLLCKAMPKENYRNEFLSLISELKKNEGIQGIIFGDIYLQEHRDWVEAVCLKASVEAIFPLWGREVRKLTEEIIEAGFRAVVTAVHSEALGPEWLGREFDRNFLKELPEKVDPCGEKGEFHTFVYDGPLFRKPVKFSTGKKISTPNQNSFLEIIPELIGKNNK